jgi:transcriptional regulator with XRE-family HTH domain
MKPTEIRGLLLMKGKTMKQFAEMIGTSRQNVHSIVTGRTKSIRYREEIAKFIEVPAAKLWEDEKTKDAA